MALDTPSILKFLEDQLGVDTDDIAEDTPLFSAGIIDSAGMLDLLLFVETEGGVQFTPDDITLDNLDSVRLILDFVAAQRAA